MEHVCDVEVPGAIHARKVGDTRQEGRRHAESLEEFVQLRTGLDLEPRKGNRNVLAGQPGHQSTQRRRIQRRFDLAELARIRHHHQERKILVGVGQGRGNEVRTLHGREGEEICVHEFHGHAAAVEECERAVVGVVRVKGCVPCSIEVDRIGQNQSGRAVDGIRWQQILDLVLGLVGYPCVDGQTRWLWRIEEVEQVHAGAVVRGQGVEEVGPESVGFLGPRRVDDVEAHGPAICAELALTARGQGLVQGIERRVQLRGRQGEVKRLGHLRRGAARRAGVGHRKGDGDAGR